MEKTVSQQKSRNTKVSKWAEPNKFISPFEYQKYKIIGNLVEYKESKHTQKSPKAFTSFILRFLSSFWGVFGLLIFVMIIGMAVIVPFFTQDPNHTDVDNKYLSFGQKEHFFGTDELGRDLWARLWWGMRFSLGLAAFVTIADVSLGIFLGILMGRFAKFDSFMQNVLKVLTNIPQLFLMIIIVIAAGASFWTLVLSMVITGWTSMALQIRSQTLRVAENQWNTASQMLGTPQWKQTLAFLPHLVPIIITQLVFTIPGAVLSEAGLSFIGLSLNDVATLGKLISDGTNIITLYPRYVLIPSSLLVLLVTSIQFIGNATQTSIRRER